MATIIAAACAALFDVRDYGAIGDGMTMNTNAMAAAISAAHRVGNASAPACALVTDGRYLSGYIQLVSHVYLSVSPTATLLASANQSDYPAATYSFISAANASHIGVIGGGTIDGQYQLYIGGWNETFDQFIPTPWPGYNCSGECRPRLVQFNGSRDILVDNITLTNSSDWTLHLLGCENVLVSHLTQYGDYRWINNDGIDIDSSRNVLVVNSTFDTADDGVCIKSSFGYGVVSNVTVFNVSVRSRSSAVKFGSNTDEDCYNLLFDNIRVWGSNRGLGIQQRSGGSIFNVTYSNIDITTARTPVNWWGSGEAIWISSMQRTTNASVGVISNITFVNITARSEGGSFVSGRVPGNVVENVRMHNVSILIDAFGNYSEPPYHDYRPTYVVHGLELAPIDVLYLERVSGMTLDRLSAAYNNSNVQPTWSGVCVNSTNAGAPVQCVQCQCTPL